MKPNIFFVLFTFFFLCISLSVTARAAGTRAEHDVFKGMEEIGIVVGVISSGMGFAADDLKKYVYAKLKSELPSLKISSISYPYLYVNVNCTQKTGFPHICHIEIELRRIVFLPDKTSFVVATVWSRGRLLQHNISFAAVKEQLDIILDAFEYDYLTAQENKATKEN